TVTLFWLPRIPFTTPSRRSSVAIEPIERRSVSDLPVKTTPGCKVSKFTTLRARKGRLFTCSSLKAFPTLCASVFRVGAADSTITRSEIAPISILMSKFVGVAMRTLTFDVMEALKPSLTTSTLYVPGGSCTKLNSPFLSVSVVRSALLAMSVTVTFAPLTAAPAGSLTVPDKLPTFWAHAHVTEKINVKEEIRMLRLIESHLMDHSFRAP